MKKLILSLLVFAFALSSFAQENVIKLKEVVIAATNYKYLNKVGIENASIPVSLLEQKVAAFDLKNSEVYQDDYDYYEVNFYIPEGYILAAYDRDGNLLRTIEKFKDVTLPKDVISSVAKRFPNWVIKSDVYLVNYHDERGITKKYKLTLQNGDERIKIKVDETGTFM